MVLEEMLHKYKLLHYIKEGMSNKGYTFKTLCWINAQLDLLDKLIKQESFDVLNELLHKTNYRLLKQIDKGSENLISICTVPEEWQLGKIEDNMQEWINPEALIFSTLRQTLVFSKNINGQVYSNNKWQ